MWFNGLVLVFILFYRGVSIQVLVGIGSLDVIIEFDQVRASVIRSVILVRVIVGGVKCYNFK